MRSPLLVLIILIASANTATFIIACTKKDGGSTTTTSSSSSSSTTSLPATSKEDIPCKDDSNKSLVNGKISSCLLSKDFSIDGYECVGSKMFELHAAQGKLKGCYLKAPKVVDGWSCQDGLSLYASGKLRRCKVTAAKSAGEGIDVRVGDWVTVFEGAGIKRLELAAGPTKVQGLPCKGYLNFFHENGKLKKCELSEDATIEGKKVSAKTDAGAVFVCFDDKGKRVADCSLLTGMTLD
jgi:hypothetical protein